MIKENCYEHPKISIKETLANIKEDNAARLRFMQKSPGIGNTIMSYLSPSVGAVILYRLAHYFFCKRIGIISKFFYTLNIIIYGCDITPISVIGPGLQIVHVVGVGIHAKIGKNALIYGQSAIGGSGDGSSTNGWIGGPMIGDGLVLGIGAKILVCEYIGNNVFVGSMSLVTKAIPDNAFVFGIPAKVIKIMKKPRGRHETK